MFLKPREVGQKLLEAIDHEEERNEHLAIFKVLKDEKGDTYRLQVKDKIVVELVNEDILDVDKADVIINTVDPEVSFREGLAKQLISKAGNQLHHGIEGIKKNKF